MNESPLPRSFKRFQTFVLTATVLICLSLVHMTGLLTRSRIDENRRDAALRILREIIPGQYDNDIFADTLQVSAPDYLGNGKPVTVFRARTGSDTLGVVYYPVTAEGYKGPIELGIGIDRNGHITGVRVLNQQETPGLGAEVDQSNSDWIHKFDGLSYTTVPREQWDLSSENGYFDQISGATITSRSVINAVRNTLDYHQLAGEDLYK
jgi:electron transport complex protein RnfG